LLKEPDTEATMQKSIIAGLGLIAGLFALPAVGLDIDDYRLVDLSHAYGDDTLYWPTSPSRFEKKELAFGETNLDHLPPTGAVVVALPMKIEGGSGGPVRVVALIGK
jgi:kynurenine formamidase